MPNDRMPNGGPAFPRRQVNTLRGGDLRHPRTIEGHRGHPGMTLRQWYAGQALAGARGFTVGERTPENIAQQCFDVADAMLAENDRRDEERGKC